MDQNTEDFLEILYLEFDTEKKKGSFNERDLFKAKLRQIIRIVQQQYCTGEAMGERRCLNCEEWLGGIHPVFGCSYDGLIHCKKLNIPGQGANFCCIHWTRKKG